MVSIKPGKIYHILNKPNSKSAIEIQYLCLIKHDGPWTDLSTC